MKLPSVISRNPEEFELSMPQEHNGRTSTIAGPCSVLGENNAKKQQQHAVASKYLKTATDHHHQSRHYTESSSTAFYDMRDPPTGMSLFFKSTPLIMDDNDEDDGEHHQWLLSQNSIFDLGSDDDDDDYSHSSSASGGIDKENKRYNILVDSKQNHNDEIFKDHPHRLCDDNVSSLSTIITSHHHNVEADTRDTHDDGFSLKPRLQQYSNDKNHKQNSILTLKRSHGFDTDDDYYCNNDIQEQESSTTNGNKNYFDYDEKELSSNLKHSSKRIHLSPSNDDNFEALQLNNEEQKKESKPSPIKFWKSSPNQEMLISSLQIPTLVRKNPYAPQTRAATKFARSNCHNFLSTKQFKTTWAA